MHSPATPARSPLSRLDDKKERRISPRVDKRIRQTATGQRTSVPTSADDDKSDVS